jgi:hyperosmotically inducible protein
MKRSTLLIALFGLSVFSSMSALQAVEARDEPAPSEHRTAGEYIDDKTLTARIKAALIADSTVKARNIHVDTYQGVVQLTGVVDSQMEADRAIDIARTTPGVQSVRYDLRLSR